MNTGNRRTVLTGLILSGLFIAAYVAGYLSQNTEDRFLNSVLSLSRHLIHLGLVTFWFVSLKQRILAKTVRRYLLITAALIGFWLYIRTVKWMFFPRGVITRYLWYAYYIPLILIPLFGVFIVHCIGKPQDYRLPMKVKLLYLPALLLIGLIFTNDLHQLAFGFPHGIQNYDDHYTYHIIYFLTFGWCICLGTYFAVMLLIKSQAPGKKWGRKFPFLILTAGMILTVLYCLRVINFDMTAVNCFLIVLLLESSIQSGFIRSNSMYGILFENSTIDACITDQKGHVYYTSDCADPIPPEFREALSRGSITQGNKRLSRAKITNGYVYWWDDISAIIHYKDELEKTGRYLEENNDLLRAELALQKKQIAVEQKDRLYDRIARDCRPQIKKLEELVSTANKWEQLSDTEITKCLASICTLSAYIKRRSNLFLIAENSPEISAKELEYALMESLDNIRLTGTMCASDFNCTGTCQAILLAALFDAYETVVSQMIFRMDAILLYLAVDSTQIRLRLQIDTGQEPVLNTDLQWEKLGGNKKIKKEEHTLWISFMMTPENFRIQEENIDEL